MSRLTRREMKRDEFLETASRFLTYLNEHTRGLLLGALALAAVVLGVVAVYAFMQGRSTRANALFAEALAVYEAEIVDSGADPQGSPAPTFSSEEARDLRAQELFAQVEARYGGTRVGRIAGVYLGKLALEGGDSARAREYWQSFVDAGDDHMLASEVRLNLLALDRAEGKAEEVATRLREIVAGGGQELPEDVALDQLAITLEESGRDDEAREVYQRIVDDFPASPYAARARERLLEE